MTRISFTNRLGFILAASGSAIGLGNIWRFPYLAGANGGAIFLFVYLCCIIILCLPIIISEITVGRNAQADVVTAFEKSGGRSWRYLGVYGMIVAICILSFYLVIAGWAFGYFIQISFGDGLTNFSKGGFITYINTPWLNFIYTFLFTGFTVFIVARGVNNGIELANRVMMPLLFMLLIGIILYSLTLSNASLGLKFYLWPDFSKLSLQTIFSGLKQSFFSLSLGTGTMLTFGSYLHKRENIISSSVIITIADTSVAFLAGLMIFPLVFSQGMSPAEGPPLVFLILPKIFMEFGPILGRILGGCFFLLLCFAALTSTISLLEVPTAYLIDRKKVKRSLAVGLLGVLICVLSIPSIISQGIVPLLNHLPFYRDRDFLTFISDLCDISLVLWGGMMCVFITRHLKWKIFHDEIALGNPHYIGTWLQRYLTISIRIISPVLLFLMTALILYDKFFGLPL